MSSQVSGKSVKSSVTFRSPLVRHKRFESEAVSHESRDNAGKPKNTRKYFDANDSGKNESHTKDERKFSNESETLQTSVNEYSPELMTPDKEKLDSAPTSFQDEIPSAAATEDTNSLASRIERNESEQEFCNKGFPQSKHAADSESQISQPPPPNFALNRFVNETNLRTEWPTRHNLAYERDADELTSYGNNDNLLLSHKRGELDMLFSPLQRSNLRWHMQENTSVKDKVGMWLEGQTGYYKDDRLTASSSAVDQIGRSEMRGFDFLDPVAFQNGFPNMSSSSSPIKHSYSLSRSKLPKVSMKNNRAVDLSPQVSYSDASDENIAEDGGTLNKHSSPRPMNKLLANDLKADRSLRNGLEMRNLKRKDYTMTSY